jgi:hypothetical protein
MQKCDIDWPICSHEPAVKYHYPSENETGYGDYSLTGIRNVEEERHRHHCEPKKGGKGGLVSDAVIPFRGDDDRIVPSVRLSAIRKSANGGIPKRALSVAKAAERKTNGAIILKI